MQRKPVLVALIAAVVICTASWARTPRNSVKWGTGPSGKWGVIVRKATATNRNIRVRFANGENPLLEVPMNATIRQDGKKASIHDLRNGERVHIWTVRSKAHEAMQAWRIYGYTSKAKVGKR